MGLENSPFGLKQFKALICASPRWIGKNRFNDPAKNPGPFPLLTLMKIQEKAQAAVKF
jgi:hypothetical protein